MRINNNMAALNSWRNMTVNSSNMQKSLEKLSSGFRINRASDDAAGLAVSEKMRSQIRGTNMAVRNAQDGISLVQTAEGAAGQIENMLQRMRELGVQAKSGSLKDSDRDLLDLEFQELSSEINRTATGTKFNGQTLLNSSGSVLATSSVSAGINITAADPTKVAAAETYTLVYTKDGGTGQGLIEIQDSGTNVVGKIDHTVNETFTVNGVTIDASGFDWSQASAVSVGSATTTKYNPGATNTFTIQVGAAAADTIGVTMSNLTTGAGALNISGLNIKTAAAANTAVGGLDTALDTVNRARATLGASQNRLENIVSTLSVQSENLTAAESRIRDVDMASEMSQFTKHNILMQASQSMLAQANQSTQGILSLLR